MANNIETASPEILKMVQDITTELGLNNYVNFLTFDVKNQKEVVKLQVANNLVKKLSEKEVVILIREDAFDRVDDKTRYFWLRTALERVEYDTEKDKVSLSKQLITVTLSSFLKYGVEAVNQAVTGIYTLNQIEEEEKQRKAEEKALKSKKRKNKF